MASDEAVTSVPPIYAAGAVVVRGDVDPPLVAVVHRPKYDDWSLPKGKAEAGEHPTATAAREVQEETGLRVALRRPLVASTYEVEGVPKVVRYWRADLVDHPSQRPFVPNLEVDAMEWLPADEAGARLTQERDAELVRTALERPAGTPFVVLRHTKALARAAWEGSDATRPLTRAGRRSAKQVAPVLHAYAVTRLFSSPAKRCRQTLKPYARHERLSLDQETALTEDAFAEVAEVGLKRVLALRDVAGYERQAAALCTHRPVIPSLVDCLLDGSGFAGPQQTFPPGGMLVVHVDADTVLAVEFHTP